MANKRLPENVSVLYSGKPVVSCQRRILEVLYTGINIREAI